MNFLKSKSLWMKIGIAILVVAVLAFIVPKGVQAKDDDGVGGKLLEPISDLIVTIGDFLLNILHKAILGQESAFLTVQRSSQTIRVILTVFVAIVAAAAAVALVVATAGAAAAVLGPVLASIGVSIGTLSAGAILTAAAIGATAGAVYFYNSDFFDDALHLSIATVTVDKIFSNEIALFDVDFFHPKGEEITLSDGTKSIGTIVKLKNGEEIPVESTAYKLQKIISNWYNTLRYIALVAMLSVLVYIGIRVITSSTAADKSKYKQMIIDWVVAMCLLFSMQYIMSFSNIIVDKITELVKTTRPDGQYMELGIQKKDEFKVLETIAKYELGADATDDEVKNRVKELEEGENKIVVDMGRDEIILWDTDFLGYARFEADMKKSANTSYAGYAILYVILVAFTIFFAFTYLKRVLYMAFLTIISPLVALTYPIDKINDGKAQAFDMWLKEYIFNLLIQPLHLLLYTILITSAFDLASQNIIYALVAIGFMIPAEKLMRKFFGFEKAFTPGLLAGPAGAAMAMAGINKITSRGKSSGELGSGKDKKDDSENGKSKIRMKMPNKEAYEKEKEKGGKKRFAETAKNNFKEMKKMPAVALYKAGQVAKDAAIGAKDVALTGAAAMTENYIDESGAVDNNGANNTEAINNGQDAGNNSQTPSNDRYLGEDSMDQVEEDPFENNADKGYFGGMKSRFLNATGNSTKALRYASRYYTRGMANKLSNKVRNAHPIRKGIRMAGGLAAGATLGALGLAAGVASGDPSKVLQYTTAAGLGGYKLGTNTNDKIRNALSVDGVEEIYDKYRYTSQEYQDKQIRNNYKELMRNTDLKIALEEKLGSKESRKLFMEEALPDYVKFLGLGNSKEDLETIKAVAQVENTGRYSRHDIMSGVLAGDIHLKGKDSNNLSAKEENEFRDTINRMGEKRKLKGEELKKFSNSIIAPLSAVDKIRYK